MTLSFDTLPLFNINREQAYATIPHKIEAVLSCVAAIKAIPLSERTFNNTIEALYLKQEDLFELWSLLSHYQKVLNDEQLRDKHAQAQQAITTLESQLSFDKDLMAVYQSLLSIETLTPDEKLCLQHDLKDFQLAGVDKPPHIQERLKEIHLKLSELSLQFQNNILDSTHDWLLLLEPQAISDLNPAVLEYFREIYQSNYEALVAQHGVLPETGFAINLSQSCTQPLLSRSSNRALRERVFRAVHAQCSRFDEVCARFDNTDIAQEIISLRHELAQLLEYPSYQDLQLEQRFASTPLEIEQLYETAIKHLKPAAAAEFEIISNFAGEQGAPLPLEPWDITYYTELWRQKQLSLDPEELREFFPLERSLSVMLEIFQDVFQLSMAVRHDLQGWHADVFSIEIKEHGQTIGLIYCDLFARPHKDQGAWMDDYKSSSQTQPAIAFLCCNFRPGQPASLLFDDLLTLFHEFGHCMHHILSRRSIRAVSGLSRVPWDIIELPSQLFEQWCYEPYWLKKMCTDPVTGRTLSDNQMTILMNERSLLSALFYLRQIQLGYFDWHLHKDASKQPVLFWHEVLQKISVTPRYADSHFPLCFSHIFSGGYSAGYYSYLWADLYVAAVFERFKQYPSMREAGKDFRACFMGLGAPLDLKKQLEEDFLKAPQSIEPFMRSIGYGSKVVS